MSPSATRFHPQRPLSREEYLQLIQTAYTLRDYPLAARVALDWLTDFPGDLPIRCLYGEARSKAGQRSLGIAVLDQVLQLDPEFTEALQVRWEIDLAASPGEPRISRSPSPLSDYRDWLIALCGPQAVDATHPHPRLDAGWGETLYRIRQSLEGSAGLKDKLLAQAVQDQLRSLLARQDKHPLVATTHVRSVYLSYQAGHYPLPALKQLVEHYRRLFPKCLHFAYVSVQLFIDSGEQDRAVALLHSLAAQDLTAQVFQRLWSPDHPFLEIWPKELRKPLSVPIPAEVAAIFGWNRLPSPRETPLLPALALPPGDAKQGKAPPSSQRPDGHPDVSEGMAAAAETAPNLHSPASPPKELAPSVVEELRQVKESLNRLAVRLKQPHLQSLDGRQPVYLALTNKRQLARYFTAEQVAQVQAAILELLTAIHDCKGWHGLLYTVDDGIALSVRNQPLHVAPLSQNDPWAIKRNLHQIDQLLAKRGEMIGAVLIVGPHEVIPFHRLPNPLEDGDPEVYSDNPYGSRDENYFVMDWPVGRLPCSVEHPDDWLIALKNLALPYQSKDLSARAKRHASPWVFLGSWLQYLLALFRPAPRAFSAFGYTAAAWRFASFAVFRLIGDPQSMWISPQRIKKLRSAEAARRRLVRHAKAVGTLETSALQDLSAAHGLAQTAGLELPSATAGYFNLHGLADSPEWFGQSDPTEEEQGWVAVADHPIALQPGDILLNPKVRMEFVFTEACFGAYTFGKDASTSIALAFLRQGCRAFVGSTCTSYGSNASPLLAADLLAYEFWKYLRRGLPAGEALRQAKLNMARGVTSTYGHLDGEDQKTLTSFVLYGDPLAQVHSLSSSPPVFRHSKTAAFAPHSTCDHAYQARPEELTPQLESLVKKLVAQYLPGMEFSGIKVLSEAEQQPICSLCSPEKSQGIRCSPAEQAKGRHPSARKIIILSRQEQRNEHTYTQYARLTLDEKGKLIKLTLSR